MCSSSLSRPHRGAAQAEKIPVYLPENAQALSLPELPEPPVLTGWQETLLKSPTSILWDLSPLL